MKKLLLLTVFGCLAGTMGSHVNAIGKKKIPEISIKIQYPDGTISRIRKTTDTKLFNLIATLPKKLGHDEILTYQGKVVDVNEDIKTIFLPDIFPKTPRFIVEKENLIKHASDRSDANNFLLQKRIQVSPLEKACANNLWIAIRRLDPKEFTASLAIATPNVLRPAVLLLVMAIERFLRATGGESNISRNIDMLKELLKTTSIDNAFGAQALASILYGAAGCTQGQKKAFEEIAQILLNHKAPINGIWRNATPLIHAARAGFQKIVEQLLLLGANPDIKDEYRFSFRNHYADHSGQAIAQVWKDYQSYIPARKKAAHEALKLHKQKWPEGYEKEMQQTIPTGVEELISEYY